MNLPHPPFFWQGPQIPLSRFQHWPNLSKRFDASGIAASTLSSSQVMLVIILSDWIISIPAEKYMSSLSLSLDV